MRPDLLKKLRALKGKSVAVTYGNKPVIEEGILVSWTSGAGSKVWLERTHSDISIPTEYIHDVKESLT